MKRASMYSASARVTLLLLLLQTTMLTAQSQMVQLRYSGNIPALSSAVAEANRILSDSIFVRRLDSIPDFDNTTYTGRQIVAEMRLLTIIDVGEYHKRRSRTNAKTQTRIRMNTAKLDRSRASIVNTLVHESIHAVDWLTNRDWNYTHRTQFQEVPPKSAPYIIGSIAQTLAL